MLRRRDRPRRISPAILLAVELGLATAPTPKPKRRLGRREEPRRRDGEYVRLPEYRAFLSSDVCGVADELGHTRDCAGPTDCEHERKASVGMGQRAGDDRAWSCCRKHHGERHALNGFFKGWSRSQLARFITHRINVSWSRYTRFRGLTV